MARSMQIFGLCVALKIFFAYAQDQLVLSIDCGSTNGYTDSFGITWESDASYIKSGKIATVAGSNNSPLPRPFTTLRYFPFPTKNCYSLPALNQGSKYLVRASFYYGNYDGQSSPPSFALQFDGNPWNDVMTYLDKENVYELTYTMKAKYASVCVAQTLAGQIPFISSLEVRSMELDMYAVDSAEDVLFTYVRTAFGLPAVLRYPDDPYDRIWYPNGPISGLLSVTSEGEIMNVDAPDKPPAKTMLHAVTPSSQNATSMTIPCPVNSTIEVNIYYNMYYAEVSKSVADNKNRSFMFTIDETTVSMTPIIPPFGSVTERYSPARTLSASSVLKWVNNPGATVPPLITALEFFVNRQGLAAGTQPTDVDGLKLLRDSYKQLQLWAGDPCLPVGFAWEWINCTNTTAGSLQVNVLMLSGYGLNGTLPDFSTLKALETIDLSNNSLSGQIPDFLALLPNLKDLNLAFNNFIGDVPSSLREKNGLKLNLTGNPGLKGGKPDHKKLYVIIAASAGSAAFLLLLTVVAIIIYFVCRPKEVTRRTDSLHSEAKRPFSYQEIVEITNNFSKMIGKGGSGNVYYGHLRNKIEVAVKVKLLMTVYHKNLVSFIGFCEEGNHMAVVYQYMANGNLGEILTGNKAISEALTWKKRVEIARDVATGLQYLHSGCRPPIIHRDIKSTNILLNEQLEPKLADFGISRTGFTLHEVGHVSTAVAGTPGYMDPEYSQTNMLSEKSDVYSFGVVVFELICGKPAIFGPRGNPFHIVSWATSKLVRRDIDSIIDPRLRGQVNIDNMWKVAELAMACTKQKSTERPSMDEALNQLKEVLEMETYGQNYTFSPAEAGEFHEHSASNTGYSMYPSAR